MWGIIRLFITVILLFKLAIADASAPAAVLKAPPSSSSDTTDQSSDTSVTHQETTTPSSPSADLTTLENMAIAQLPPVPGAVTPTVQPGDQRDAQGFPAVTPEQAAAPPASSSDATQPYSPAGVTILDKLACIESGGQSSTDSTCQANLKKYIKELGLQPSQIGQGLLPFLRIMIKDEWIDTIGNGIKALANEVAKGAKAVGGADKVVSKAIGKSTKDLEKELLAVQREIKKIEDENKHHVKVAQKKLNTVQGGRSAISKQVNRCKGKSKHSDTALDNYINTLKGQSISQQNDELEEYIKENNVPDILADAMRKKLGQLQEKQTKHMPKGEPLVLNENQLLYLKSEGVPVLSVQQRRDLGVALQQQLTRFPKDQQDLITRNRPYIWAQQMGWAHDFVKDKKLVHDELHLIEDFIRRAFVFDLNNGLTKRKKAKKHWNSGVKKIVKKVNKGFEVAAKKTGLSKAAAEVDKAFEKFGECVGVAGLGTSFVAREATYGVATAAVQASKGLQELDPRLSALRAEQANIIAAIGAVQAGGGITEGTLEATQGVLIAVEEINKGIAEAILKGFQIKTIGAFIGIGGDLTSLKKINIPHFDITGVIVGKNFNIQISTITVAKGVEGIAKAVWKEMRHVLHIK